ncbi:hypothetical protein [Streptomyces kanamyceticus]|uniref:Uncharacterized protein n=1 Tax=Streptomyces kanamyceticus TaxID=1967 RepID=A0A5J6G3D6_STRKN|nr:hypothetical protein [Streptomyces kanamyceticus]QEU90129.1 hypothetical protein CP970_03695 [Streptomyces kanamyceticus]
MTLWPARSKQKEEKQEIRQLAGRIEREVRQRPFRELSKLLEEDERFEVSQEGGRTYQVVIEAFENTELDQEGIRVAIAVDDGGWSALAPVSRQFFLPCTG